MGYRLIYRLIRRLAIVVDDQVLYERANDTLVELRRDSSPRVRPSGNADPRKNP
jgi:hypothetical protein